jgi:hypothetical protein
MYLRMSADDLRYFNHTCSFQKFYGPINLVDTCAKQSWIFYDSLSYVFHLQ